MGHRDWPTDGQDDELVRADEELQTLEEDGSTIVPLLDLPIEADEADVLDQHRPAFDLAEAEAEAEEVDD